MFVWSAASFLVPGSIRRHILRLVHQPCASTVATGGEILEVFRGKNGEGPYNWFRKHRAAQSRERRRSRSLWLKKWLKSKQRNEQHLHSHPIDSSAIMIIMMIFYFFTTPVIMMFMIMMNSSYSSQHLDIFNIVRSCSSWFCCGRLHQTEIVFSCSLLVIVCYAY